MRIYFYGKPYKNCIEKSSITLDILNMHMKFDNVKLYQTSNNNVYVELTTPSLKHNIDSTEQAISFENTHKKSIFNAKEIERDDFIQNTIINSIQNKEIFLEEFGDIKTEYKTGYSIRKTLHPMVRVPLWLIYNNKLSDTKEIIKMFFDEYQYRNYVIRLYSNDISGDCIDIISKDTEYINCICKALELENGIIKSIVINPMYESYVIEVEQNTKYFKSLKTYEYIRGNFYVMKDVLTASLSYKEINKFIEFEMKNRIK